MGASRTGEERRTSCWGAGQRERAQEEGVDDTEHRSRGSDAQRHGDNDGERQPRATRSDADGVTQVVAELNEHGIPRRESRALGAAVAEASAGERA